MRKASAQDKPLMRFLKTPDYSKMRAVTFFADVSGTFSCFVSWK